MDPRLETKSAINEAVIREIERAGQFGNPKIDKAAITAALLDGPKDDHQKEQLRNLLAMVDAGNPDTKEGAWDDPETPTDEDPKPFGVPSMGLRKAMLAGQQGRGWSQDDVDKAGRLPIPRELSQGDRQYQEISRRASFLEGIVKSHASPESEPSTYNYGSPSGPLRVSKNAVQERAAEEFNRTRDQKRGESGYMGALENPEYLAGRTMNHILDPLMRQYQYAFDDGDSYGDAGIHAKELQDAQAASKAVAPLLPGNPQGFEAKEQAYRQVKGMADKMLPLAYDYAYRRDNGSYPSFAGSKVREFLTNLIDPPTVVAAGLTGGATLAGSLPVAAAKASRAVTTIPRLMSVYGRNAKTAYKLAAKVGPKVQNVVGPEEFPTFAGINAGVYASTPELASTLPKNLFHTGNLARTDLYEPGPDGKPREQNKTEFDELLARKAKEKAEARGQFRNFQLNAPKAPYKTP